MIGENFKNGGKDNVVTIVMIEKHSYIESYDKKEYCKNWRFQISNNSIVTIQGIDIIEKINDSREITKNADNIGVFTVYNSKFFLLQCKVEISSSPFINIPSLSIGSVYFGHTRFDKNAQADKKEITIVGTETGWDFKGNKAIVSKSHTYINSGCILEKNPKIEYID